MPRTWVRKTERGVDAITLERAVKEVERGCSVRKVAKKQGICHVTLYRYWEKWKVLRDQGSQDLPRVGYVSPNAVFSKEQEEMLAAYISEAADIYFGLTPREIYSEDCNGIDPYSLGKDLSYDLENYPSVEFPDIFNYLVLQTSFYTAKQMKAWKSMEAYNFFVRGWVKEVAAE